MNKKLTQYFHIAQAVSSLFYPFAEVVVHDLKTRKIAAIFNNVSKRKVGDDSLIEELGTFSKFPDVFPPYFKTNWDGRKMKSATATLKDEKGKPIGLFCVNVDLSKWEEVQGFIGQWMQGISEEKPNLLFKEDWREKINHYVSDYLRRKGLSLKTLSNETKRELVLALHREGAFQAKNAASYIAEVLEISRATIYNYLR